MERTLMRTFYIVAMVFTLVVTAGAFTWKYVLTAPPNVPRAIPFIGEDGSEHIHASMVVMIGDQAVDFCKPEYLLRTPTVHFENNDCTTVHKHASGVTLAYFLDTIGIRFTNACMGLPDGTTLCSGNENTLRVVVNGATVPVEELTYYNFKNDDRFLIYFGPESGALLLYRFNQVPFISEEISIPYEY